MRICVVGSGYVGLVTGACLADFGMTVTNVDKDAAKIAALRGGEIPIYEPGLETLVATNVAAGRLTFATELAPALEAARAVFIAVGTPPRPDGSSDLSFVREVAEQIGAHLNDYKVIVTKSTVPIGTGRMIEEIVTATSRGRQEFAVVSNPEFLREGSAIEDFLHPDRLVIGSRDPRAIEIMLDIYSPLRVADVPFVITDTESSEMIKYASNSFLATKISFINEIAHLCERLGADVEVVARGMGLDKRIGSRFLHPGPGFGGSCFPKDAHALVHIAREHDTRLRLVETVLEVNDLIKLRMVEKIAAAVGDLGGKTAALLGLSFKPDTDDMRDSPALTIAAALEERGCRVRAHDPAAMTAARALLPSVELCGDAYECAEGADVLVIVTEWNQFRALDLGRLRAALRQPVIVDLRNIYEPAKMAAAGFRYTSVGRQQVGT
ncbi:MAG TPA: UDP-glucose/GDP-mannose dehydrogenase family protein [Thermoanaerobaculia bacterium]|nr:UDP-glucose/GDP-mannose dehydrogenase family protein [Thermoanaerobaculia bacterium]